MKMNNLSLSEMIIFDISWFFIISFISMYVSVSADIFFLVDIILMYLINLSVIVIMISQIMFTELWIDKNNLVMKFMIIVCQNCFDVSIVIELFSLVFLGFLITIQIMYFLNTLATSFLIIYTFCIIFS